ncbi:unnamed protein product [Cyclocybe aegerita]|uniref:CRAL-TRIO domain-containing protein n=1 Tax=Cyclocybe aegerita TaxID=1973307 RepID=A0A8S0W723_CYCAE|nr:unnamed protein product [Cyclocybe aegerita]
MGEHAARPTAIENPNIKQSLLLAGHLGNLTIEQEKALETFKENLAKAGLYTPAREKEKASHDDPTLLRFLRARSFNPTAAQKQFSECENWRKTHQICKLYYKMSDEDVEHAQRFYPRWTGRRDKLGIPLFVYRLASLDSLQHELYALPAQQRSYRLATLYEHMTRFTMPLCSHIPRSIEPVPVSSITTILDLENISFGSMWRLRHHLQEASKLLLANYPETLHSVVIVNSPSFFPTIWNWIKGWFDEGTRQKIHILGKDSKATLLELVQTDDLPVTYGGGLSWEFEDAPDIDEEIKRVLPEIPKGPLVFVDGMASKPPAL